MLKPVLFIIRHGRTSYNQKGLFRGEADIPLTPEGIKDSEQASNQLSDEHPAFIISSDKIRALQTAKEISKSSGVDVKETPLIRAWNLVKFSGQPKNKENLQELEQYIQDPDKVVPEGESLNQFRDRILPVLAECFEHATRVGVGFVVAHSSVIHEVGNQLFGNHKSLVVKPGGIVVIGFDNGEITADRIFKPLRNDEGAASVS
jgi:probable phosphoglycerate mutase